MEVVPGELSGHVDDLTVLTPSSLLYRGLPRKSSDQRKGGESISRPSILGLRPPSSSTPHKRAPPHRLFCHLLFLPLPPCAYNLASAKSTSNLLSRIDFLSFYFPLFFYFCLEETDIHQEDINFHLHRAVCHFITRSFHPLLKRGELLCGFLLLEYILCVKRNDRENGISSEFFIVIDWSVRCATEGVTS